MMNRSMETLANLTSGLHRSLALSALAAADGRRPTAASCLSVWHADSDIYGKQKRVTVAAYLPFCGEIKLEMSLSGHAWLSALFTENDLHKRQ